VNAVAQILQPGRTVRFRLAGAAAPKERVRARIVTPKGKRPFLQWYTPKETVAYEERIKAIARRAWGDAEPSRRPIELQVTVHVEIPSSWSKWKAEGATRGEIAPTDDPDLDNIVKAVSDAMNGVVYADDAQVIAVDAVKLYAPQGSPGWIEVAVRENWRAGGWIKRLADFVLLR
jgi:Holliday junction resolvase RusA-like endonuclease